MQGSMSAKIFANRLIQKRKPGKPGRVRCRVRYPAEASSGRPRNPYLPHVTSDVTPVTSPPDAT
ncbi:hypothetical protein BCEN4_2110013 [Burkholderia cenocepacia]|nr:hypothetical protein BCEN4_2110013 [Burkholderia cenocepacia]